MKKTDKNKELLLEQLRKTPIVQVACEKTGVSRMTFYRWKKEDAEFSKLVDKAFAEGRSLVSDLAESQLMAAVRDRNLSAIMYWLKHHHEHYSTRIEVKHVTPDEGLTPEQETMVREALRLASVGRSETAIIQTKTDEPANNLVGIGGGDDAGQENPDSNN